jgi:hypothetical protein
MTIGKAYRDIQAAKRKAQAEIQKARWEHPLVARPTATPEEPSKHHHAKTRARHDSIMTKTIGAEEQFDLKSTPQSVIDEVKKIMKKKKNSPVIIHGEGDKDESNVRTDNDASSYTDHSFKEATNPAIDAGAGPSSPINTDSSPTRNNPANKIRSGFSPDYKRARKKAIKKSSNFQKIREALNKKGDV